VISRNKGKAMTMRIQRTAGREFVVLALSGRIEGEALAELRRLVEAEDHHLVLDLKELKLVDRDTVKFLAGCEAEGTKLENCPQYIREWIVRERDGSNQHQG
jgi:hypothetical protein